MNRDAEQHVTISSPLEAHKAHSIVVDSVGVDNGFDNPVFACIECPLEEEDAFVQTRFLVRYELDMGLNCVLRKSSVELEGNPTRVISLPGGGEGPGGVLIASEGMLSHYQWTQGAVAKKGASVRIPQRRRQMVGASLIVAHCSYRQKGKVFVLVQTEDGDVWKVTPQSSDPGDATKVTRLHALYFDTLPPASSLAVLRNGFLFLASAAGPHHLYQFTGVGDEKDLSHDSEAEPPVIVPRPLANLVDITFSAQPSLSPLTSALCADFTGGGHQPPVLLCSAGRGPHSSALHLVRHGLPVTWWAQQKLPGVPDALWTIRKPGEPHHNTIVMSFPNATLTLGVSAERNVHEITEAESGIVVGVSSIHVAAIGPQGDDVLQVTQLSMRHIRSGHRINVWSPPPRQRIVFACSSPRQVCVALSNGELVYFELDPTAGVLLEMERCDCQSQVLALAMAPPSGGEGGRSKWLAYADSDSRLRVLSLDPRSLLERVALQQLTTPASSLAFCFLRRSGQSVSTPPSLFIFIGTRTGLLLRSNVDVSSGALADSRSRFLGLRPVRLVSISVGETDEPGVVALGDRPWLVCNAQQSVVTIPLASPLFQSAAFFSSPADPHGWIVITGDALRIMSVRPSLDPFFARALPLPYTPRRMAIHASSGFVAVAQAQAFLTPCVDSKEEVSLVPHPAVPSAERAAFGALIVSTEDRKPYHAACVSLMNPYAEEGNGAIELTCEITGGGDITCMCSVPFTHSGRGELLCVGLARESKQLPEPSNQGGRIALISVTRNAQGGPPTMTLEQVTDVNMVPTAMAAYNGFLLCGFGKMLRMYDVGKKQLLKKCEEKDFPRQIVNIVVLGNRFVVGDSHESALWCMYDKTRNVFRTFADDCIPRFTSAMCGLDYNTIAIGDKFGSISILRVTEETNEALRMDAGSSELWKSEIFGARFKTEEIARFRVGQAITSLNPTVLSGSTGGSDPVVLYTTITGAVGVLAPIVSTEDVDFVTRLEQHLRAKNPPILGNMHLRYRSAAAGPALRVFDGDLCETFSSIHNSVQRAVAQDLGRESHDVLRKLEDLRKNIL